MRELRREPLLATKTGGEPLEQPVERAGQLADLVVGIAEAEAAVEIVFAPFGGLPRHSFNRAERREEQPARRECDEEQQQSSERQ